MENYDHSNAITRVHPVYFKSARRCQTDVSDALSMSITLPTKSGTSFNVEFQSIYIIATCIP